jgi:hypothetical protein
MMTFTMIEHKTEESLNIDIDCVFCGYCQERFCCPLTHPELVFPVIEITQTGENIYLHKNCVVAFAARIVNEFEKL